MDGVEWSGVEDKGARAEIFRAGAKLVACSGGDCTVEDECKATTSIGG